MNTVKEDLLLHPVRLRIILTVYGRQITALQMADELPDIPQATLYRNINTLAAAGILVVVRERRVRNTIEKTYALPDSSLMLSPDDVKDAGPADHIRLVTHYLGLMLGYFVRYVDKGDVDLARDNVVFQTFPAYLTDAEIRDLGQALTTALMPYVKNEPSPERRRFVFGLISVPDVAGPPSPPGSSAAKPAVEAADPRDAREDPNL